MKILFLFPYPLGFAASQRFRFEQYLDALDDAGHTLDLQPFLDEATWKILYQNGKYHLKFLGLLKGLIRRLSTIGHLRKYDMVFVHREAEPIGPPLVEWAVAHIFKKKMVFDLDDAIWIPNSSEHNRFFSAFKRYTNAFDVASAAYKVSVGNSYLASKFHPYNTNVTVNPTTIDTEGLHNRLAEHSNDVPCVGWTGSHSTLKYLEVLFPIIRRLKQSHDFRFIVISDSPPLSDSDLFEFIAWNKASEIEDLLAMNIGIMPLVEDAWSKGKCGFKALQYMSLGIPALVSPVGVNEIIVDNGKNGFICHTEEDWEKRLKYLIGNREACSSMGLAAREKVEQSYSVKSNMANFLNLFT
ncbi:MAG: glycosyltransferase family 4 protein [Vicingaceae bacterium]